MNCEASGEKLRDIQEPEFGVGIGIFKWRWADVLDVLTFHLKRVWIILFNLNILFHDFCGCIQFPG